MKYLPLLKAIAHVLDGRFWVAIEELTDILSIGHDRLLFTRADDINLCRRPAVENDVKRRGRIVDVHVQTRRVAVAVYCNLFPVYRED